MDRNGWRLGVTLCLLLWAPGAVRGEIPEKQRDMVERVWQRLLSVAAPLPALEGPGFKIELEPPIYQIEDNRSVNAYASWRNEVKDDKVRVYPRVVVFQGLLTEVVGDNEDFLAYVLGHELGHIMEGHLIPSANPKDEVIERAFDRKQEIEADLSGMKSALKAGYSFPKARAGLQRMEELNQYTSYEALNKDHPTWKDRLVGLDPKQSSLWRAMSAFDNGSYFLLLEQYRAAERCFETVVEAFPDCYEGWANLGYARLMRYCDQLEAEDIKDFEIGQLVVGGFYRRPESLEILVLRLDPSLWKDAVKALETALDKRSDLVLAKASLGVAYLVKWDGRDLPNARKYLDTAVEEADENKSLDQSARAALLVNAGVADLAAGSHKGSAAKFDQAEKIAGELRGEAPSHPVRGLRAALLYNRAVLALAGMKRREALKNFEEFLRTASPASAWYDQAHERYAALARDLGEPVKEKDDLAKRVRLRPVTAVEVKSGREDVTVVLGQPPDNLPVQIRQASTTVPAARFLMRLRDREHDLDLLASEKAVLAIRLYGAKAPNVELRATGISGKKAVVRVGMKNEELEAILKDEDYDQREFDTPDGRAPYRFYRDVGLAVRVENGGVKELLILARQEHPQKQR